MPATLNELITLLNADDPGDAIGTSVRIPRNLKYAAQIAIDLGLADNMTDLAISNLRSRLEGIAQLAVLNQLYEEQPELRPTLAELAVAAADMDGSPLARHPDLIRRAAETLTSQGVQAEPDDVLLYAAGLLDGQADAA